MTEADVYDYIADQLPPETLKEIDDFWAWFSEKSDALDAYFTTQGDAAETDPFEVMDALNSRWPDLMWEFGPSDKGHMLVITAEWRDENRALARALRRRAPDFDRWEIAETRAAVELDDVGPTFEARFQEQLSLTGLEASVSETGRIDLSVTGTGDEDQLVAHSIKLASLLLGEEGDRDWLGQITGTNDPARSGGILSRLMGKKKPGVDIATARADILAAIDQAKSDRPDIPYNATGFEDREATLFQAGEMPTDHTRADLLTYVSPTDLFGRAVLSGERFASPAHSAHDETFVFLRLPNQNGSLWETQARGEVEAKIHDILSRDSVGGYVAGGTGRDAAYIDMALNDVPKGLARLSDELQSEPFYTDATLHFMDAGLTEHALPLSDLSATVH